MNLRLGFMLGVVLVGLAKHMEVLGLHKSAELIQFAVEHELVL